MAFKKLDTPAYPRRLWGLYGFPGSGKSTFAARLRGPLLAIDADHRFEEVTRLAGGNVYSLSDAPADNVIPERIAALLRANMPGADVRTLVIDSLTAILAPLVTRAILDNDAGRTKNRMTGFKDKALAMRLLQDSVTGWGTDCLWIWHLQEGRNAQAEEVETATVSRTELARLTRSAEPDAARRGRWRTPRRACRLGAPRPFGCDRVGRLGDVGWDARSDRAGGLRWPERNGPEPDRGGDPRHLCRP